MPAVDLNNSDARIWANMYNELFQRSSSNPNKVFNRTVHPGATAVGDNVLDFRDRVEFITDDDVVLLDELYETPGMYTLLIPSATTVFVSGKGGDGGQGGQGGNGGFARATSATDYILAGGAGGTGRLGRDGVAGSNGSNASNGGFNPPNYSAGGGGGEGEWGETGGASTVTEGSTIRLTASGSLGSAGGPGGVGATIDPPFSGVLSGGAGGRSSDNPQPATTGNTGLDGSALTLASPSAEVSFAVAANTTLTIVVGGKGRGGNPGSNGQRPHPSDTGHFSHATRSAGSSGAADGWVRVRTEGSTSNPLAASASAAMSRVAIGSTLALMGSASGGSGSGYTYAWTATGGSFNDIAAQNPVWTHPTSPVQTYDVTLTVTDSAGATATDTITVEVGLQMSDFTTTGLSVDVLALLTVGPTTGTGTNRSLYQAGSHWTPDIGSLVAGELELGNGSLLSRVLHIKSGGSANDLIFNDQPDTDDLGAYFASGGAGNNLTIHLQTDDGVAAAVVADTLTANRGANWAVFDISAAVLTLINGLSAGDRLIVAFTRPSS